MTHRGEPPKLGDPIDIDNQPPPDVPTVAVLVCHGMGQQIKFQTLNDVAYGLRDAAIRAGWNVERPVTRLVRQRSPSGESEYMPRAEQTIGTDLQRMRLHVYESYWAPLTAGRVTLRDVALFLVTAGVNGFRMGASVFTRLIEGEWRTLRVKPGTRAHFAVALLFVLSLLALNSALAIITSVAVLRGTSAGWPGAELVQWLTYDFALFELTAAAFAIYAIAVQSTWARFRDANASARDARWNVGVHRRPLQALAWIAILGTIVSGTGALVLPVIFSEPGAEGSIRLGAWFFVVVGVATILSLGVRWFLVQYLGDVVAYVSSHTVNRFYELRREIQKSVLSVGRAVYRQPQYHRVVLIGHSLGSVIAYDLYNALLVDGRLDGIPRRTAFVTFGSPLDKTAFVFRSQQIANGDFREALATGVQALLTDPARRPSSWTNVWSGEDWISGDLDFYGLPLTNIEDQEARIPLVAHTQYWRNALIFDQALLQIANVEPAF